MIRDDIRELQDRTAALKAEHAELVAQLAKKKNEVQGLIDGQDKFKSNPKLLEQFNSIIKQRAMEIGQINQRLQELNREALAINTEIKKTHTRMNKLRRKTIKIADSPAVSQILDQALAQPQPRPEKPADVRSQQPIPVVPVAEPQVVKEEKVVPAKPLKTRPSKDLYEQAASESKAQEEFLKSQSTRSYGAA